jgi:hypothetical protein
LRRSANITDVGGKRAGVPIFVLSCGQGTASSFYRPRGGSLQSCCTVLSATYGGMAHSVTELMVVLTNLAPVGRRSESYTCPGAASRVAVWDLPVGRRRYANSRARLTEGRRMHSSGRGSVSSSRASTAPGMVLECLGWRCSARDGGTAAGMAA